MKMEIQTISRSLIRPSSPTPPNLKTYNLSGIDQINPSLYNPIILFYAADPTHQPDRRRSFLLKQSLSHTLSRYYPLAGKLKDGLSIDCCDAGAFYSKAKIVNSTFSSLSQFLDQLDLSTLRRLFPVDAVEGGNILAPPPPGSHLLLVQETSFPCGGVSIGMLAAHDLLDASSIGSFVADWSAAACRIPNPDGGVYVGNPKFAGDSIFPQNAALFERLVAPGPAAETATAARKRGVTRRFVFHAPGLASLKKKIAKSIAGKDDEIMMSITPSRVQAVTALLTSCILRAAAVTATGGADGGPVVITQAVNLRRKAYPQFPPDSIGNHVINAVATLPAAGSGGIGAVAKTLMDSVSKIDADFVEAIRGEAGKSRLAAAARAEDGAVAGAGRRVTFTSLSRLGFYEANFGWGRPVWMGSMGSTGDQEGNLVVDFVVIMDLRDGLGLEAWVYLDEDEMDVLQNDWLLLEFADLDLSPNVGFDDYVFVRSSL